MQSAWSWRPPPIMKVAYAQHHTQLLATFFMDNPLEFSTANVKKLQAILEKLNNIYRSGNINGLLVPSSSPLRFHERNMYFCKKI